MIDSILGLALLLAAAPARAEGTPVEQDARQCYQLAESDPARAVGFCTRAIESGQLAPAALANAFDDRCWARGNIGQYDLAIADCDAALKLSPQAPFAFGNRGTAYLHQGQYERAIADYDRSIALFAARGSGGAEFYFGRAIAYSRLGQKERAEADFRRAVALEPDIEARMAKAGLTR
jgi:tetratricopeptide (TPR) repeat protein